ncbi:hypothetical protein ECANGB1_2646 [Enterospora canceri]|uniref:Uncharacterized protein n=1 Tax=Enterospora canceri TaxID=1081671 RepID=A0A1Y1S802_9MICR|nr:hypothetical protein ECANGB1_2646 [Enterospora canceri]
MQRNWNIWINQPLMHRIHWSHCLLQCTWILVSSDCALLLEQPVSLLRPPNHFNCFGRHCNSLGHICIDPASEPQVGHVR